MILFVFAPLIPPWKRQTRTLMTTGEVTKVAQDLNKSSIAEWLTTGLVSLPLALKIRTGLRYI